jgi:hypothetical protein
VIKMDQTRVAKKNSAKVSHKVEEKGKSPDLDG